MSADYLIVGGGVYGAATAWFLARAGASVLVIEAREIASRASGGPGRRGVRANGRDLRELALMRRAYEIWPTLHEELDAEPFYERTGHLLLAETDADCDRLEAQVRLQEHQGIPTERLDGDAARELEPALSPRIRAAARCPLDGVADHTAATRAYAAAAERLGATIETGVRVGAVEVDSGRATSVVTDAGDRLEARRGVLLLANPAVAGLLARLGPQLSLPRWNVALQVIISEPVEHVPFRHLTGHVSRTVSLKTEGASQVMVSGGWRARWDPDAETGTPLAEAIAGNLAEAAAVYPALEGLRVAIADAGHQESWSVDGIPVVDRVPGVQALWLATGWCGHGWAIAPVVAELLAGWVLGGPRPALLEPFSCARFGQ